MQIRSAVKKAVAWWRDNVTPLIQDVASPSYCAYCWKLLITRVPLCSDCKVLLRSIAAYDVVVSASRVCTVYALSAYEEPIKSLIRAKQSRSIISSYQLGHLMAEAMASMLTPDDVLVPVPLHWRRYAWRGFNQADIIATVIAHKCGISVVPLLQRSKNTEYQAEVNSKEARQANVQKAFSWNHVYNPRDYTHKRLVIIDDLMTTGSTIRSMVCSLVDMYATCKLIAPPIRAYVVARVTR